MKHFLYSAIPMLLLLTSLSSCGQKPYTITGTLDLPEQIPYGDTLIEVPSFEGTWVYLLDFENQLVDSVQIEDNSFEFSGKVDPKDTYFLQLTCQVGSAMVVIEPGDIEVNFYPEVTVGGTPSNDAMAEIDSQLEELNVSTYQYMAELTDSLRMLGQELTDSMQFNLALEFQRAYTSMLDDAYEQNKSNMAGIYAVLMRHMNVQSADEFERALSFYPERVRNNDLLQLNLRLLRQYEMIQDNDSLQLDPSLFGLEPEGTAPQN